MMKQSNHFAQIVEDIILSLSTHLVESSSETSVFLDKQKTLAMPIACEGQGVHSGHLIQMCIKPADINSGIVFVRSDIQDHYQQNIFGRFNYVVSTQMCTTLANQYGVSISTVEHIMSAFAGYGITNAYVEVSGSEIPIMDGSARPFCALIELAGVAAQSHPSTSIEVVQPIRVENDYGYAEFIPHPERLFSFQLNQHSRFYSLVEAREITYNLDVDSFSQLVAYARTFGFYEDAQKLYAAGLAKGASLENTVVIKDGKILNDDGLRHSDEMITHKILDAIGDISLAGTKVIGHYRGVNAGHALNNQLLHVLFSNTEYWRLTVAN